MQLSTKYAESDVKCVDLQPSEREERHKYKYYCPICLRYFTHMLQSACCQNYLCIHCTNDVKERETKDEHFYAECPYKCNSAGVGTAGVRTKFILTDVDEDAKVKRYSDSQCMSFFSNNLGAVGA